MTRNAEKEEQPTNTVHGTAIMEVYFKFGTSSFNIK